MAQQSHIDTAPSMIIEDFTDSAVERRIESIDRRIHTNPEEFKQELAKIGELAIQPIELDKVDERVVRAARKAGALIEEFLGNRYDLDSSFDPDTEAALKQDPTFTELLDNQQKARNLHVQQSMMVSALRKNPLAEQARDAVRAYRLQFYVDRVAAYNAQAEQQPGNLPSAG